MVTEGLTVLEPLWQGLPPADPDSLSGSATCALPPHYEAVRTAREFTQVTLNAWQLGGRCDDVTLVVSELVTNALRHGLPTAGPGGAFDPPVRLHLMRWASRLVCAVRDPSGHAPVSDEDADGLPTTTAGYADDDAESGRGLFLVEAFSDSWGWEAVDGPPGGISTGKVVWALFRLPPDKARA
ncbi:ATP-binding protein [Streptomyces durbertensis]|uniref:ATP-binding protein n=1 Tax=Streptomyces durbertensis TaxID=2448886 RepID=A0ABR6EIR2_9ACTN|nr:ATP-binding protein [Streptomyces durbertensis]MBB1245239.1 ATP-binding protein [Streptomyces durbertensis]